MVTLAAPGLSEMREQLGRQLLPMVGIDLGGNSFCRAMFAKHIEEYIIGGVRGGKTTCGAGKGKEDSDWHAFLGDRVPCDCRVPGQKSSPCPVCGARWGRLGWVAAPTYEQTHQEMEYLNSWAMTDAACRVVQWNHPNEGQWTLVWDQLTTVGKLMRVTVETKSGDKEEGLSSVAPDWIILAEAGQCGPGLRKVCLERLSETGGWLLYEGTLEDEENKPQFAWYVENSAAALDNPTPSVGAYSLPSWENHKIYGDCRRQLAAEPLYAEWCPDGEHGTEHSGLNHPVMRRLLTILPRDEFDRRYGGKPVGLQFAVYRGLDELLLPCPSERMAGAYGGIDYGGEHPSAIVACTMQHDPLDATAPKDTPQGIMWVREVWFNDSADPGDPTPLRRAKQLLADRFSIRKWGVDPNERYLALRENMDQGSSVEAVSLNSGSRDYRINLTKTRISLGKLKFDESGPGVKQLLAEMKKVHRYKTRSGELKLARVLDDRTAALEDAIEIADGIRMRSIPKPQDVSFGSRRRRSFAKRRTV